MSKATIGSRAILNICVLLALGSSLAAPLSAQTMQTANSAATVPAGSADELAEVTITGTLIRGVAPVGAPVLSLSSEEISNSGVASVVEMLRKVPQVTNIGIGESRTNTSANLANSNTTQGNGINLRGLGTQATLILVNGYRPAPSGLLSLYWDPSDIPTIALQGIDVVADGASALYGSDAIAGVANLILRRDYSGAELSARYGVADSHRSNQLSGILGRTWGGGGFMVALERSNSDPLYAADRPAIFAADQRPYGGTDLRTDFSFPANIVVGNTVYGVPANPNSNLLTFANLSANRNLMSGWTGATAMPEQERWSIVSTAHQQLGSAAEAYAQLFYTRRKVSRILGRVGLAASQSTLTVRNTNPYFITGIPGVTTSETVRYSWLDALGPEDSSGHQINRQVVAGLKLDLTGSWQADVGVSHSFNEDMRLRINQPNLCALSGSVSSVSGPCTVPAGQVPGGAIAQTTAANAFNPFGTNNASVIDRIRAFIRQESFYQIDAVQAKADGKLFTMSGGDARLAVGAAYARHEEGYYNIQNNDTADNSIVRVVSDGGLTQNVSSLFGEMVFPFIGGANARPGVQSLQLSMAGRYEKYSNFGSTSNPKLGFTWGLTDGFKVRGSYGTSFRTALVQTDGSAGGGVTTRTLADYTLSGGTVLAMTEVGGQPNVKPEESTTYTLGMDFSPQSLPGLQVSLTWFDLDYEGIIDNPGNSIINTGITSAAREQTFAAYIIRRPAAADVAGNTAFTAFIQNKLNSPLFLVAGGVPAASAVNLYVDGRSHNSGRIKSSGLDVAASYAFRTAHGDFTTGVVGTYYTKFDRSFSPLEPLVDRLGVIEFPNKWGLRVDAGWKRGGFNANLFLNYLPGYTNNFVTPAAPVKAYSSVDMTLGYEFGPDQSWRLALESQNVLDSDPPLARVSNQTYDSTGGASPLGRTLALRLNKKF